MTDDREYRGIAARGMERDDDTEQYEPWPVAQDPNVSMEELIRRGVIDVRDGTWDHQVFLDKVPPMVRAQMYLDAYAGMGQLSVESDQFGQAVMMAAASVQDSEATEAWYATYGDHPDIGRDGHDPYDFYNIVKYLEINNPEAVDLFAAAWQAAEAAPPDRIEGWFRHVVEGLLLLVPGGAAFSAVRRLPWLVRLAKIAKTGFGGTAKFIATSLSATKYVSLPLLGSSVGLTAYSMTRPAEERLSSPEATLGGLVDTAYSFTGDINAMGPASPGYAITPDGRVVPYSQPQVGPDPRFSRANQILQSALNPTSQPGLAPGIYAQAGEPTGTGTSDPLGGDDTVQGIINRGNVVTDIPKPLGVPSRLKPDEDTKELRYVTDYETGMWEYGEAPSSPRFDESLRPKSVEGTTTHPLDMGLAGYGYRRTEPGVQQTQPVRYWENDVLEVLQGMSPTALIEFNARAIGGRLINPNSGGFKEDSIGDQTIAAMEQLMAEGNRNGRTWQVELVAAQAYAEANPDTASQAPFQYDVYMEPDYARLAQQAKSMIRQTLGREANSWEMKMLTDQMAQLERQEFEAGQAARLSDWHATGKAMEIGTGAIRPEPVQEVDSGVRLAQFFEDKFGGEIDMNRRVENMRNNSELLFAGLNRAASMLGG